MKKTDLENLLKNELNCICERARCKYKILSYILHTSDKVYGSKVVYTDGGVKEIREICNLKATIEIQKLADYTISEYIPAEKLADKIVDVIANILYNQLFDDIREICNIQATNEDIENMINKAGFELLRFVELQQLVNWQYLLSNSGEIITYNNQTENYEITLVKYCKFIVLEPFKRYITYYFNGNTSKANSVKKISEKDKIKEAFTLFNEILSNHFELIELGNNNAVFMVDAYDIEMSIKETLKMLEEKK